jgi:putative NADPH-quinone reductase
MQRKIVIIQGHPDASAVHFGHALADAYAVAAANAGHQIRRIEIARLDFPLLRSDAEWRGKLPANLEPAQEAIGWSDHVVLLFPLWQGTMPALVKAFLEQVFRPGFAVEVPDPVRGTRAQGLRGKSARLVVTMGMPSVLYRCLYLSHGVKCLERNILRFCGVNPVRKTLIGLVDGSPLRRIRSLDTMRKLGDAGR